MAWENLRTDYTDVTYTGQKKYTQTNNDDGTVSFTDVTNYNNKDTSFFGAKDANAMNGAINTLMATYEDVDALVEMKPVVEELATRNKVLCQRLGLTYGSKLEMRGTATFSGETIVGAMVQMINTSGGAWSVTDRTSVVVSGETVTVRAHGTQYVSTNVMSVYVIAIAEA